MATGTTGASELQTRQSGTGAVLRSVESKLREQVSVKDFGAVGDGSTDDTAAIQAAIDSTRGTLTGGQYYCNATVFFPGGTYKVTSQINLYTNNGAYNGCHLAGVGPMATIINWYGPSNQSCFRQIGKYVKVEGLWIQNQAAWVCGYSYDGDPAIGISTGGEMDNVFIGGNAGLAGDGIRAGANAYQADQWKLNKVFISYMKQGRGLRIMDGNAVAINAYNLSVGQCWIGIEVTTSANFSLFGGEIDTNDVNFKPGAGASWVVHGTRSEDSKRQVWTPVGGSALSFSYIGNTIASFINTRSGGITASGTATATTITLSAASFTFGDFIDIAGAGPAGATLSTRIIDMSSPTSATIADAISTTVTTAAVSLTAGVAVDQFVGQIAGSWVYEGNTFNNNPDATSFASVYPITNTYSHATQEFIGNSWSGNNNGPFNSYWTRPSVGVTMLGNRYDVNSQYGGPFAMYTQFPGGVAAVRVATETGSNNAVVGASQQPLVVGLVVNLVLAHTLQAGANTFNYNSGGAVAIKSNRNSANNIATAWAVGGVVPLYWNGTVWLDMTQ